MKKKIAWLVVSSLMVLALLVSSCAKKEEAPAPAAPAAKEAAAPAAKKEAAAPAAKKEAAPAVKEAAPVETEAPQYGGTLMMSRSSNILNWDERYLANWMLSTNLGFTNENLCIGDWAQGPAGTGQYAWSQAGYLVHPECIAGALAESWEFPDEETIIYNIRPNVQWALDPENEASALVGGRDFNADDAVFNIRRILWEPTTELYQTAGAARPTDVYATDENTVVVKTPKGFLGMTWEYTGHCIAMMAPEIEAKYGDYQTWENCVGTGPFILKDFVSQSSAYWERNPNYFYSDPVGPGKGNQLPYVDDIKYLIIPDESTRMAALRTGKIDYEFWPGYNTDIVNKFMKENPHMKHMRELGGFWLVAPRLDEFKPGLPWAPQDDPNAIKVRRALNLAMNNQEVCDVLYGGDGETLSYKIVPNPKAYEGIYTPLNELPTDLREIFEYHPEKAKTLLTEAGYPDGFKAHVCYSGSTRYTDFAPMLKQYWKKNLGVDLELRQLDRAVYTNTWVKKTHEEMIMYGRSSYNPHVMYSSYSTSAWNLARVNDPKLDDFYAKMAAAYTDWDKKSAIMKELNLYAISRVHHIHPPVGYRYFLWQPWMKNFHGEVALGVFKSVGAFKFVWLDSELKKSLGF